MATRMQQRRGTSTQWTTANPILNVGEIGYETDTNQFKIGDGTNHWDDLPYFLDETQLSTQLGDYVLANTLGEPNGVATLNSFGLLESSQIPNISEQTADAINDALVVVGGLIKTYDDSANTLTLATDDSYIERFAVESVANSIIDGTGITTNYDSIANTITIQVDTTIIATKAELVESAQDSVNQALVAGTGIEKLYDDSANTITVSVSSAVTRNTETQTLTNKTISLSNNTVSGSIAEFNTALVDGDFVTTTGAESLTNKTIQLGNNSISGTLAEFNSAVTDADFVSINGVETLSNKTIDSANNTITITSASMSDFTEAVVDKAANALTSGTHTNISISYDDNAGTISLTASPGYSDEQAQDAIGNSLGYGLSYDDSTGAISVNTNQMQARIADVSDTEIGYLANVTSDIQTQLNSKASSTDLSNHESDTTNIHGIANTAAIVFTTDTGTVTSTMIANGTIVNDDINASAAIALSKLATDPLARANHTGTQTASTISDFDTQVRANRLDQMALANANVSLNSFKITNLAEPTTSTDAATKNYVDLAAEGLAAKPSVLGATTTNIDATYSNGTNGVGATLTHNTNGAFPADAGGATGWQVGSGILVKNQTNKAHNGRYVITNMGSASTPYVLTRCGLCDEADEIPGAYIFVQGGTLAGTGWVQTVANPSTFVVGTDNIDVYQFSGAGTYTAGTGLTLNGTVFSINTGTTVDLSTAQTLTNKTINLSNNTLTGTLAQFNTAVSDADLASLAGSETLLNKTINLANNTVSGTIAQFNTALSDGNFATISGTETLTNKTLSGSVLTGTLTANSSVGSAGQYLESTGTGVRWTSVSGYSAPTIGSTSIGSGATVTTIAGLTLTTARPQLTMNAQTGTTYTLALNDASSRWVTCNNTGAITVTVPPSVFTTGDTISIQQTNTGQVTFAQGAGVTITSAGATSSAPKIRTRYASATVVCTGSNTFTIVGDIV